MTYDDVVRLVEQLSPTEQSTLIAHLLHLARQRQLSVDERKALLRASILNAPVAHEPSVRRQDWYDTDAG